MLALFCKAFCDRRIVRNMQHKNATKVVPSSLQTKELFKIKCLKTALSFGKKKNFVIPRSDPAMYKAPQRIIKAYRIELINEYRFRKKRENSNQNYNVSS